jgi:CRAL/TRIO domain
MLQNLAVEYEKFADPRLPACSRKSGHLLETCCTIMDLKGVGITRVSSVYAYLKQASALSQNYYPERLGRLYLINAPWGFSSVFSVVKSFLDPVTVQKIHVLGANYQKELLDQVPAENLPEIFGGTCSCPGGCAFSDEGPWTDAQWTKPAKWQLPDKETASNEKAKVIDNTAVNADEVKESKEIDSAIPATGSIGAVPSKNEANEGAVA